MTTTKEKKKKKEKGLVVTSIPSWMPATVAAAPGTTAISSVYRNAGRRLGAGMKERRSNKQSSTHTHTTNSIHSRHTHR
jgi:hypothetical protein